MNMFISWSCFYFSLPLYRHWVKEVLTNIFSKVVWAAAIELIQWRSRLLQETAKKTGFYFHCRWWATITSGEYQRTSRKREIFSCLSWLWRATGTIGAGLLFWWEWSAQVSQLLYFSANLDWLSFYKHYRGLESYRSGAQRNKTWILGLPTHIFVHPLGICNPYRDSIFVLRPSGKRVLADSHYGAALFSFGIFIRTGIFNSAVSYNKKAFKFRSWNGSNPEPRQNRCVCPYRQYVLFRLWSICSFLQRNSGAYGSFPLSL